MDDMIRQATGSQGFGSTNRSNISITHRTRPHGAGFRHFLGGRCARSFGGVLETRAFAPFRERANGALREAQP